MSITGHMKGITLRNKLTNQKHEVYNLALSNDGVLLAVPTRDGAINLWDIKTNKWACEIEKNTSQPICTAWSPDSRILAYSNGDRKISLWNFQSRTIVGSFAEHVGDIRAVAWAPDGSMLASCSDDRKIIVWNPQNGKVIHKLLHHSNRVSGIAWSPDNTKLCSCSWDESIVIWNVVNGSMITSLEGHHSSINSIAWSPDGKMIASASDDMTLRIWDPHRGTQTNVIEAHTDWVVSVAFIHNGALLCSLAHNKQLMIWNTKTWSEVARFENIGQADVLSRLVAHQALPLLVTPSENPSEIDIWKVEFETLIKAEPTTEVVHYVNAKAVLVGESGVGKSGLAIRIVDRDFKKTESTHGARFWQVPLPDMEIPGFSQEKVKAELTLWDLAGQPEYRLVHQLFLDDTDLSLLLFDCSDSNDPFRGVPYWSKVIKKQAPPHTVKILVSARCDVSPVTVETKEINKALVLYGLDSYCVTSAKTGFGVDSLFKLILEKIPWSKLPKTTTPKIFEIVRGYILSRKEKGDALVDLNDVKEDAVHRHQGRLVDQREIDTVVSLLQTRGLIFRLTPKKDQVLLLTKPEMINQYASSIIQAARNHSDGIGAVSEREVLIGEIPMLNFERVSALEESKVLNSTVELLIRHDLCFREMGQLVFPSQIKMGRPDATHKKTRIDVAYQFSGSIETIYASLVVRLNYTNYFHREDQWRYAVDFSRNNCLMGFTMHQVEEGTGELEIYFQADTNEFDRVTFISFITDHLKVRGIDIKENILLYCPSCGKEITNKEAIQSRIAQERLDIMCQFCDNPVMIPKSIEERYRNDKMLMQKSQELVEVVEKRTKDEVSQFKKDQEDIIHNDTKSIYMLHLSDLHIADRSQARWFKTQLETDLRNEMKISRLDYVIITGDIANTAKVEEYEAAFELLDGMAKRFGYGPEGIIVVPGNHDVNWNASESSYEFIYKRNLPFTLEPDKYIKAGDMGMLVRNEEKYAERFSNFAGNFYKKVYNNSRSFPLSVTDQAILHERADHKLLFLALNSCWQIDHHYQNRAGINRDALSLSLDRLQDSKYNDWKRIAIFHHPIHGHDAMNDEFLEMLVVNKFSICMHGHIHEAIERDHKYDQNRGLQIIGGGTCGAPARQQVAGIPLQYNILELDTTNQVVTIHTRKKEKTNGSWKAAAIWGDANDPKAHHTISI